MKNPVIFKRYVECLKDILVQSFQDKAICVQFLYGLMVLGLGVLATIALPFLLKKIVDTFSSHASSGFTLVLIGYGLLWTLNQASFHLRALFTYKIEQRITFVLGLKVLSHLFHLSHGYFLDQKPGAITNVIRRAQRDVPAIVLGLFFHVIPTFLEFLGALILISSFYSLKYSISLSCILGAFFVYTALSMKSALKERQIANEVDKAAEGIVVDWLSNHEAVRTFGRWDYALSFCREELQKREQAEVKFISNLSLSRLGQTLILGIGLSLQTFLIGQDVSRGILSVGDFVLFNGYILQFIIPVSILGHVTQDVKKALLDMKGIIEILLTESQIKEAPSPLSLQGESFLIEFKDVSFKYQTYPIFEDVSLKIKPQETALIIGPTGTGKSTFAKLLMRIYDPNHGEILINNTNLKEVSFRSLSNIIGWVPQESYLLNDTIQSNLLFSLPEATTKEIEEALEKASLLEFVRKLPEGLNTFVGDRGLKLSGGEKQRLALARLFLKQPKICIFDEPTSFLDRNTELTIQRNIETYLPHMTKIIITHRPFMFEKADQIITLEKKGILIKFPQTYMQKPFLSSNSTTSHLKFQRHSGDQQC